MKGNPVVQVALISESSQLQMMLSTYGITTQTPHEVEPVQVVYHSNHNLKKGIIPIEEII